MKNSIILKGVKQNNLKNIDIEIPIGSFTTICGPSGSGKSSLAFETLYAEGQRRYIENLSNYTKQFLNKAPKPDIESIENIPPSISLEQKNSVKSSRSTVGTTTEITDYLRLLFEKAGTAYCPTHEIELVKHNTQNATDITIEQFSKKRGYIMFPLPKGSRNLKPKVLLKSLIQDGFMRVYIPKTTRKKKVTKKTKAKKKITSKNIFSKINMGDFFEISDKKFKTKGLPDKDIFIVVDRLGFSKDSETRIFDSFYQAYNGSLKYNSINRGRANVLTTDGQIINFSEEYSCTICDYTFPNIDSRLFSFNSPIGACESCSGFGNILEIDPEKVIPNPKLTLREGAIKPFTMPSGKANNRKMVKYCEKAKISIDTPWEKLPKKHQKSIWEGTKGFLGVLGVFDHLETKKYKMHVRVFLARHKSPSKCPDCKGARLKPESLQVSVSDKNIHDLCGLTIARLHTFASQLKLSPEKAEICKEVLYQLVSRLGYLLEVGVGYLTMDRPTKTLSGGEFQRIMLSNQLGMGLSQTLYVLDEPTIGLHPRDNDRLIEILKQLNDLGNTLVIVEHDLDIIKNSTHVIELGPGSGHLGGEIIYAGTEANFYDCKESKTANHLRPGSWVPMKTPRAVNFQNERYTLEMKGCSSNNLKNVDVKIPLNRLVTVTGVSGSGKSTLISSTLYPAIARKLGKEFKPGGTFKSIEGINNLKSVLYIDQSPIGKTARSTPVSYLKVYDAIRTLMASSSEAHARGYRPSTFSLNVDGGRCPVCKGIGFEVIDMMFMDDINIECEACDSKKFRPEVLDIKFRGKNIFEVLSLTVKEAMDFFVSYPNIRRPLSLLKEVGLDYIQLGQTANTLSGGESQRLKVAKEIHATNQHATLYILDEPTTGLHFDEVQLLIKVLNKLIDAGGSVILIEHNLEIIKNSDYIIDLGPEAGSGGGKIIAEGTPEEIMTVKKSHTGRYLKQYTQSE